MQNTFSGAYRLIHQNFAHCIRQCKWQLVRLRISQADCQTSLWVPVDQKHFLSGLCQTYSQVRTGCCFANASPLPLQSVPNMCHRHIAPFLVGDGDHLCVHDFTSFLIVAVVSGNRKSRHFKINSEVTALSIAGIRVPEMKKAPSIYTVCYIKFIFNYSN